MASTAHGFAAKEWTAQDLDLDFKQVKYSPWGAYGNSKLANVLFARELDRRFKANKINATDEPLEVLFYSIL